MVCPVPDSGMGAALGFAQESGLPFEWGLIRNHYVGRTFIQPRQGQRSVGVKIKLNPVRQVIEGRRVVLIDDSIVRGTTSRKIVRMVREAGAREVHVRISSPPTTGPCYYGIDTPLKSELIASSHTVEEIRRFVEADSLAYLSHEGLLQAVGDDADRRHCTACFSGRYPVAVTRAGRVAAAPLREGAGLSGRGDAAPPRRRPREPRPTPGRRRARRLGRLRPLTARRLGWEAAVLTSAGPDFEPERELPGVSVLPAALVRDHPLRQRVRRRRHAPPGRDRAGRRRRPRGAAGRRGGTRTPSCSARWPGSSAGFAAALEAGVRGGDRPGLRAGDRRGGTGLGARVGAAGAGPPRRARALSLRAGPARRRERRPRAPRRTSRWWRSPAAGAASRS